MRHYCKNPEATLAKIGFVIAHFDTKRLNLYQKTQLDRIEYEEERQMERANYAYARSYNRQ